MNVYELLGICLVIFTSALSMCVLLWLAYLGARQVIGDKPVQTPQEIADEVVRESRPFPRR